MTRNFLTLDRLSGRPRLDYTIPCQFLRKIAAACHSPKDASEAQTSRYWYRTNLRCYNLMSDDCINQKET